MASNVGFVDILNALSGTDEDRRRRSFRTFSSFLLVIHLLDVSSAVILLFAACEWKHLRTCAIESFWQQNGYSMKNGASICVVLALSRCIIFPTLSYLAIKLGVEKRHLKLEKNLSNTRIAPVNRTQSQHSDTVDSNFSDALQVSLLVEGGIGIESENDGADESAKRKNIGKISDEDEDEDEDEMLRIQARERAQYHASVYKYAILALIFIISTGYQVYAGVKVSMFEWNHEETLEAVMMCLSVLWINIQAYVVRSLIEEMTREKGLYLPEVHRHPIFLDRGLDLHRCDLCGEKMRKIAKGGNGWRCRLCDFDVCRKCAGRKDVAQVSENMLRGDKGVKAESEISNGTYLSRAMAIAKPESFLFSLALICLILNCSANLALPSVSGRIINDLIASDNDTFYDDIKRYLITMIIQGALTGVSSFLFALIARKLVFNVRNKLFDSVIQQDVAFFDGTTSGHLLSRLTNDINMMMQPIRYSLSSLLQDIIMLVGGVTMCYVKSYRLSMLAFVTVGPIMFLWDLYGQWSKRLNHRMIAAWGEANSCANQALQHIKTVKAFSTEASEMEQYRNANDEALQAGIKSAIGQGLTSTFTGYLDLGTGILILWFGGLLILHDSGKPNANSTLLTVGELVAFQLYWSMMNNAYQSLQGLATSLTMSAAGAEKVFSLWDSVPDIDPNQGQEIDWNVNGELQIQNVNFFYQMRPDNIVLNDMTLRIPAGSVCALVGRSGGGKSTLIKMLMRFYDPKAGNIMLDGRDFTSLRVSQLRRCFGVVAQDTKLFAKSILYNIAYGMEEGTYTKEDVIEAARKAQAHDFIMEMKDGYDSRVGEEGGRISGGQRQRIAIARVFLRNPKIILLDEATSALDEESQHAVQEGLDALIRKGGSTVVLVAHRLSTVQFADKIVVMDKGVVAEEGTHEKLLNKGGIYANLVKMKQKRERNILDQTGKTDDKVTVDSIDSLLDDK